MAHENTPFINTKHPLYPTWKNMRRRCYSPSSPDFKNYGKRGIKVCEAWESFKQFCEDMGDKPVNMTLDRINNNGDYCKENCRWSDRTVQNRNSRRCILDAETVAKIRQEPRKKAGGRGGIGEGLKLREIAKKYNVTYRNVRAILDKQTWNIQS